LSGHGRFQGKLTRRKSHRDLRPALGRLPITVFNKDVFAGGGLCLGECTDNKEQQQGEQAFFHIQTVCRKSGIGY